MNKPRSAREFFERVATRGYVPGLQGVRGTYRFDIEDAGSWRATVDDGAVTVREGTDGADCVLQCDEQELLRLVRGEQNAITAIMQGRVRIEGDLVLAMRFHGLLPGPDERLEPSREEAS